MALYKQHGVNPLAGCLPMFLQMPIWLALYRMLSSAGELYQQPFIPGWIDDLTAADPYHVLPVVLMHHDVPPGAAHAGAAGSVAEDAAADDAVRHAADVRRDVVLLPRGPDALHLHEHVPVGACTRST